MSNSNQHDKNWFGPEFVSQPMRFTHKTKNFILYKLLFSYYKLYHSIFNKKMHINLECRYRLDLCKKRVKTTCFYKG